MYIRGRTSLVVAILTVSLVPAEAPPPPSELLVAEAASLYASLSYSAGDEDQAIRKLSSALRQDPTNREARELLAAIQKRREQRQKERERQGQQGLAEQSERGQDQRRPQQEERGEEPDRGSTSGEDRRAPRQPDEGEQAAGEPEGGMSRAEAERLLDALQAQEERPAEHQRAAGRRPQGPRW